MKLARVRHGSHHVPALVEDGALYDISAYVHDIDDVFLRDGMRGVPTGPRNLASLGPVDSAVYGPPVTRPGKIVCIGLNYHDHAAEVGAEVPSEPVVFMKATNTLVGPDDTVLIPRGSVKTDYEVELAVVIGGTARYLDSPDEARTVIAGYAISNDVSEREFQLERGGQWDKGKSCETFNPFGPWLVTAEEVRDPQALSLQMSVNGEVRQAGTTADMVFSVDHIVWYLSQFMVLEPGDIINTGTPAGVVLGSDRDYLRPGDVMEAEISGLGRQRQVVERA